jgi:hypothetical protein
MQSLVLAVHILCGALALIAGLAAMRVSKRRGLHTRLGEFYHWLYVGLFVTAAALAVLEWERLWWLLPVGVFSYAFALLGYVAAKRRGQNWLRWHLTGQGGSYIAMSTAVLVVNAGIAAWWAWILPTLIGSPLIAWTIREVTYGRRPRYAPRPA